MKDQAKTKKVLIQELEALNDRLQALEQRELLRSQAEEAIWEREARLHLAMEASGFGMYDYDFVEGEGFYSPEFLDLFGLPPGAKLELDEELVARAVHSEDRANFLAAMKAANDPAGSGILDLEYRILKANGEVRWLKVRGRTIFSRNDRTGIPLRANGIVQDITARKQAEEALRKSEEKFVKTFQSNPACIGLSRLRDGLVIEANDVMLKLLGYSRDEFIGHSLPELGVWNDPADREQLLQTVITEGRSQNREYWLRKRSGELLLCNHSAESIRIENETHIIFTFSDLTEQRQAEEERKMLQERLQRAEKMESLGLLAGGVAHDLNNALGILVGYAEFLYESMAEDDPLREDARSILIGGQQAAAIVQDLLTLARRGVQTRTVVQINKIVTEYLKSAEFTKLMPSHPDIRVTAELSDDLLKIAGSPAHLSKTLMNLVSNAAEAITSGGDVIIRTENRYLDRPVSGYEKVEEGDYVVLTVSDEGKGIAADDMRRIFEPFYTKKVMGRSGTGLGLSVVWGTVKDHSGYIDVRSSEDRGTTFTLYFPVTRQEIGADEVATPPDEFMGRGESILVVDDVKEQRDLAGRILTRLNYRVARVESGEEAVDYLKTKEADLVVLDMIMDPGIDGFETYRRILEIKPGQRAVIVSGFAETERVAMAQSLGAGAYVRKPYIMAKIGAAIRRELDRK